MRTNRWPRFDFLHPGYLWVFAGLVLLWTVAWAMPPLDPDQFRLVARLSGYLAAATMAVPYLHVARRFFRYRDWGAMRTWLRLHIGCAYASGLFLLLHSQARAHASLTFAVLIFFWVVMLSGVVGFYGQKLLYRLLPLALEREVGLERLGPERERLLQLAAVTTLVGELGGWKEYERRGTGRTCPPFSRLLFDPLKPAEKRELAELAKGTATPAQEGVFLERILAQLTDEEFLTTAALLADEDVRDWTALSGRLAADGCQAHALIGQRLSKDGLAALTKLAAGPVDAKAKSSLLKALNEVVKDPAFADAATAAGIAKGSERLAPLLQFKGAVLSPGQVAWRNRYLVEAVLREDLIPVANVMGVVFPAAGRPGAAATEHDSQAAVRNRRLVALLCEKEIAGAAEKFWEETVARYMLLPFPAWRWVLPREHLSPLSANAFDRVKALSNTTALPLLVSLETLVDLRRQLNVEFWYHRLGRVWLLFHGPASAALFILSVDHIWMSVWYGGW